MNPEETLARMRQQLLQTETVAAGFAILAAERERELQEFAMQYQQLSLSANIPLKVRLTHPSFQSCWRHGYEVLEDMFGCARGALATIHPVRQTLHLESVAKLVTSGQTRLGRGALFFSDSIQPCWFLNQSGALQQISCGAAVRIHQEERPQCFIIFSLGRRSDRYDTPRFARHAARFKLLAPVIFSIDAAPPKIERQEPTSRTCSDGRVEISGVVGSLTVATATRDKKIFCFRLPTYDAAVAIDAATAAPNVFHI